VREREDFRAQIDSSQYKSFDIPDGNFIIRSSDNVNFHVHKSVLAMASPFFKDLLSLPQPPDSEFVNGLPVVQLSESAELLNSLISILYPIRTVIPNSYEKVLYLLVTGQRLTNSYYKVVVSARGVSEVRDGFSSDIYPFRGHARRGIPSAARSRGFHCIRDCE
jgi:hypothetical protein